MLFVDEILSTCPLKIFKEIFYISDGAAGHFKNKYQFYEFSKGNQKIEAKWIFTAIGNGGIACDGVGRL